MEYKGVSLYLSADSEAIGMMPKIKASMQFMGQPCMEALSEVKKAVTKYSDMVPIVFADFSVHAIQRQLGDKESAASFIRRSIACLQEILNFIDQKEGRTTRTIVRTEELNSIPRETKEQLEKMLGALPVLFQKFGLHSASKLHDALVTQ
jgi:hypothetical protein